jgi:hypothetical protein
MSARKNKKPIATASAKKSMKPKPYLKKVNGKGNLSELDETSLNDLLDSCNGHWCDKDHTLVFPLYPEPPFVGPTGLNEVPEKLDTSRIGHVIGHSNELIVLRMFETISKEKSLGLKLFSGIKFSKDNLELLASVFNFGKKSLDSDFPKVQDLETDLICIYKGAICLAEIKSKSNSEKLWVSKLYDVKDSTVLNSFILENAPN